MTISMVCTACGVKLKVPDPLAGKRIQCKACQHIFRVDGSAPDGQSLAASQPSGTKAQQPVIAPSTLAAASGPSATSSNDLGIVCGLIMAMIGVSTRNPFEAFTMLTVGTLASLIVPAEHATAAGRMLGTVAGKSKKNRSVKRIPVLA